MSVNGEWMLHYDWGCTGNYYQAPITFNSDGTFNAPNYIGRWAQNEGKIEWRFDGPGPDTVYSGDVVDAAMVGISSTFAGKNGCWYALRSTSTTMTFTTSRPEYDEAGNEVNPRNSK
jgi:hypothetical protein